MNIASLTNRVDRLVTQLPTIPSVDSYISIINETRDLKQSLSDSGLFAMIEAFESKIKPAHDGSVDLSRLSNWELDCWALIAEGKAASIADLAQSNYDRDSYYG